MGLIEKYRLKRRYEKTKKFIEKKCDLINNFRMIRWWINIRDSFLFNKRKIDAEMQFPTIERNNEFYRAILEGIKNATDAIDFLIDEAAQLNFNEHEIRYYQFAPPFNIHGEKCIPLKIETHEGEIEIQIPEPERDHCDDCYTKLKLEDGKYCQFCELMLCPSCFETHINSTDCLGFTGTEPEGDDAQ